MRAPLPPKRFARQVQRELSAAASTLIRTYAEEYADAYHPGSSGDGRRPPGPTDPTGNVGTATTEDGDRTRQGRIRSKLVAASGRVTTAAGLLEAAADRILQAAGHPTTPAERTRPRTYTRNVGRDCGECGESPAVSRGLCRRCYRRGS